MNTDPLHQEPPGPETPVTPERPASLPVPALDSLLEDYLDHVFAPLVGVFPYSRRMELRNEMREHLATLVEAKTAEGSDAEHAVSAALKQFGHPVDLAERLKKHRPLSSQRETIRSAWPAVKTALIGFETASLLTWAILLYAVFSGGGEIMPNRGGLDFLMLFAFPLFAGLFTGAFAPCKAGIGTIIAVSNLILVNTAASYFMPPELREMVMYGISFNRAYGVDLEIGTMTFGVFFPLVQLFYWLPLGVAGALFSAWVGSRAEHSARRRSYRVVA